MDHSVHGFNGVEPPLPPPSGQVLANPDSFQVLQGVQVGSGQPSAMGREKKFFCAVRYIGERIYDVKI